LEVSDPAISRQEMFMRRFPASLVMLVVSVASAHGQALEIHHPPGPEAVRPIATTFHTDVSAADGCPVGLFADRRSELVTRLAEDGRPTEPAQGLHIRLIRLTTPKIERAEVTVYGVTPRAGILPLGDAAAKGISKTFILHPDEAGKESQEATVWMHEVGVLTHVELNSLTYADGSVWHESDGSKCRAVPSLFLLVGAK
jgi:hypothetical protein